MRIVLSHCANTRKSIRKGGRIPGTLLCKPLESLEGIYPTRGGSSCRTKASASRIHVADLKATEFQLGPGLRAARDGILDWEWVGGWGCVWNLCRLVKGTVGCVEFELGVPSEGTLLISGSMMASMMEAACRCRFHLSFRLL